ncbi:hypothetical protein [Caballeronia grimmiae]|nr:hypothetical protein [Caballeronia grimmiae]GGD86086.1 hypothetical protein GCM10010985_45850 [Caballeronia grimmiae]
MKKTTVKHPKFKARLGQALTAISPNMEKLRRFQKDGFDPKSGTQVSDAIFDTFRIKLHPATVQRWINGQGYPSEDTWPLLTAFVGRSREQLIGEEPLVNRMLRPEAAEPGRRYGEISPSERLLELLDEARRIVKTGL